MGAKKKKPAVPARYVVTHWHESKAAVTYDHQLHDASDEPVPPGRALRAAMLLAGIEDGDEIEITVTKTGRRPHADRKFVLCRTGIYEREPDA